MLLSSAIDSDLEPYKVDGRHNEREGVDHVRQLGSRRHCKRRGVDNVGGSGGG